MAFPTTPVLDDFNRTAEQPIGGGWNAGGIFGGVAAKTNGTQALSSAVAGTYSGQAWNTQLSLPVEVYCDLPAGVVGTVDIYFLSSPTSGTPNGYSPTLGPTSWQIGRYIAGAGASLVSGSVTWGAGDSVGFTIDTTGLITMWRKPSGGAWAALGSATDTTFTGPGYIGFDANQPAARIDNFGGGVTVSGIHLATWQGPFQPASLVLPGVGLARLNEGDAVPVTSAQQASLAASDPDWWSFA